MVTGLFDETHIAQQSIAVTVGGYDMRLIAYETPEDVRSGKLKARSSSSSFIMI